MKHYYPKSQQRQLAAVLVGVFLVLGVNQKFGLDWDSAGPPLLLLLALAVCAYLTTGTRVDVHPASGSVRTVWRLVGIPLRRRKEDIAVQGVELRPEWTHWYRDAAAHVSMDYNLVLAGHRPQEPEGEAALDLKKDQMLFRLAERRARAVGEELGLPVAVRWDLLLDDTERESRDRGDWRRPFAYPQELKDWRQWVTW